MCFGLMVIQCDATAKRIKGEARLKRARESASILKTEHSTNTAVIWVIKTTECKGIYPLSEWSG